jgi:predicted permease
MENLWADLRQGARMLVKNPGFTIVAALSLALGIGANSAIFSVANALLLRPLPFAEADRLVILWSRSPGLDIAEDWFSPAQFNDVKTQNEVFDEVAMTIGLSYNLTGDGAPERVDGAKVTSSLFPLLGAEPALGRTLTPQEDVAGATPTVVLSDGFWRRRYGADPEIVGKAILLNGNPYTVIGVMKPEFAVNKEIMPSVTGIRSADLLLPLPSGETELANRKNEDYNIFGRLKPGVTVAQAQANMDTIAAGMKERFPEHYPPNGGLTVSVVPLLEQVVGDVRQTLYVLLAGVGFVLLVACANVANLLLARAAVRQKEIAVRTAVGASRARIVRQLLVESVLLALTGGLLGLALTAVAIRVLRLLEPENIPRLVEVTADGRVVAFTFVISVLTGVVFGLVPALRASRVDLNDALKDGSRGSAAGGAIGRGHHRVRDLLVVAEVAMSLVLLIGAGLLVRSYARVTGASPGFDPRGVISLRMSLPAAKYTNPEAAIGFYRQLDERVRTLPGVESVATTIFLPLSSSAIGWSPVTVEGFVPRDAQDLIISNERLVSPDYFRAMSIPLLEGRPFDQHDVKGAQDVAIVDDKFAERFWPNESPVGKRIKRVTGDWRTIVGVVSGEKEYSPDEEPPITLFYPVDQFGAGSRYLVARTSSDPAKLAPAIVEQIRALDPDLPVYDVSTMERRMHDSLARQRFSTLLLGVFAASALALAAIGIYGVLAYWVEQRTHEVGIRLALGARQGDILRLVIRRASILLLLGVAGGLAGAYALTHLMSSMLFKVSATDLLTFTVLPALLAAVGLLASYIPARRATKVDPMVALRYE